MTSPTSLPNDVPAVKIPGCVAEKIFESTVKEAMESSDPVETLQQVVVKLIDVIALLQAADAE